MHRHEWECACVLCALTVGTGAPLFKVSPWALKALTEKCRHGFSPHTPPPTPSSLQHLSQPQNYYQSFPGEKQRGNVIWKRGANPPKQQLLPNHNNLGKGCGLYFMGGEGPRMFIYLSPQSASRCVYVCVRLCLWQDLSSLTLNLYRNKPKVTRHSVECRDLQRHNQSCVRMMNM